MPFYEKGSWSEDGGPIGMQYWVNYFGNSGEIFYLNIPGENTIKFQSYESTPGKYKLLFASDSMGNGKFKISGSAIIQTGLKNSFYSSEDILFMNNRLLLPSTLKSGNISICNIRGQKILSRKIQGTMFELPRLSSGIYLYSAAVTGSRFSGSFIIK